MGLLIFTNDIFCLTCLASINFPFYSTWLKLLCGIYSNRVFSFFLRETWRSCWPRLNPNSATVYVLALWRCCIQQCPPQVVAVVVTTVFFVGYNHTGIIKHTMQIICLWDLRSLILSFSASGVLFMFTTLRVYQSWWIFSIVVLIWTINGANRWMLARIWTTIDMNNGCDGNWQAWIDTLMETHKNCLIQGFLWTLLLKEFKCYLQNLCCYCLQI
jgi:hypothetical protein